MTKVTLGGDRLGSGNRMKQQMHNFYRSNKNLSTRFYSTMAPGVLYPCYTNVALKGDTFDIDLSAFVRTIPTRGPLYGAFKLQIDFFQVPFRLYQAILHNNTTDIARKMNQVYLPKYTLTTKIEPNEPRDGFEQQINTSSLPFYTNMAGIGRSTTVLTQTATISRKINALPILSYYDIFKNYYSNKQEENAYVISKATTSVNIAPTKVSVINTLGYEFNLVSTTDYNQNEVTFDGTFNNLTALKIYGEEVAPNMVDITINNSTKTLATYINEGVARKEQDFYYIELSTSLLTYKIEVLSTIEYAKYKEGIQLIPFELSNIDDMRKYLLTQWDLGTEANLNSQNYQPYKAVCGTDGAGETLNKYPLNGLVVKTYQSDMFNNWLDTEWVNEITQSSAIDVSNGSFTIDMLNFKKKLYDHLNRLALSGGTYDDWQLATYGDKVWGKTEKPIFVGGMSSEIQFDEVISTAATNIDGENDPLGSIAGRGNLNGRKGGHITIKVGEASIIMGIVSITPRLVYTQGNAWYNTELDTMDDLHKPIFDRIGFQDLMVEQMAWWDTVIGNGTSNIVARSSAGKQPAWLNYATDIDRAYGEFAAPDGKAWMILSRQYSQSAQGGVSDVTTYIDPEKFNYPFAYRNRDAQNFWTFIGMKIHARRKMSNTQIPNV